MSPLPLMCAPDTGYCNNFQLYLFVAFNALVRTSCYLELTTKVRGSITALECSEPRWIFISNHIKKHICMHKSNQR